MDLSVSWVPSSAGTYAVSVGLFSLSAFLIDLYDFEIEVEDASALPVAVAEVDPASGQAPLGVRLDGSASVGAGGAPLLSFAWDMGDGELLVEGASAGGPPTGLAEHAYPAPGGYTVTLEVVDALGLSAEDKVTVSVATPDNEPPTARIEYDMLEGRDQHTVRFRCDCSDPDGQVADIQWEYGDGDRSSLVEPVHTYLQPQSYRVRLTIWDDGGLPASDSVWVVVKDGDRIPPRARIVARPVDGDNPLRVNLAADASDEDGFIVSYRWFLPDGSTRSGPDLIETFTSSGYYDLSLEVEDDDGLMGRDQRTIYVRSNGLSPPRIVSEPTRVARVGVPYGYDEDGRPSAQGGRPIVWRVGKQIDGVTVNRPDGMTIDAASGEITWTPTQEQLGEQPLTLVAQNEAAADLQEYVIDVVGEELGSHVFATGCTCSAHGFSGGGWLLGAAALVGSAAARRRRKVRR